MPGSRNVDSGQTAPSAITKETDYVDSVSHLTAQDVERLKDRKPRSLGIRCRRSECAQGLHCFEPAGKRSKFSAGVCRDCGADIVDWQAVWSREPRNIGAKFDYFQKEWIRHFFLHLPITTRIEAYAQKNGFAGLAEILEGHLNRSTMLQYMPPFDRKQTAMLDGTILHWARHATGCCCRKCLSYWHNIPLDRQLTTEDIKYLKRLAMQYVAVRMPRLIPEIGESTEGGASVAMNRVEALDAYIK